MQFDCYAKLWKKKIVEIGRIFWEKKKGRKNMEERRLNVGDGNPI